MGCLMNTNTTVKSNVCCDSYNIIKPSEKDTEETLRQIYEHNAVYEEMCNNK